MCNTTTAVYLVGLPQMSTRACRRAFRALPNFAAKLTSPAARLGHRLLWRIYKRGRSLPKRLQCNKDTWRRGDKAYRTVSRKGRAAQRQPKAVSTPESHTHTYYVDDAQSDVSFETFASDRTETQPPSFVALLVSLLQAERIRRHVASLMVDMRQKTKSNQEI